MLIFLASPLSWTFRLFAIIYHHKKKKKSAGINNHIQASLCTHAGMWSVWWIIHLAVLDQKALIGLSILRLQKCPSLRFHQLALPPEIYEMVSSTIRKLTCWDLLQNKLDGAPGSGHAIGKNKKTKKHDWLELTKKHDWPWVDWRSLVVVKNTGKRLLILFSLLFVMFETFHNKKESKESQTKPEMWYRSCSSG